MLVDLFDRFRANRLSLSALDDGPALTVRGLLITGVAVVAGLPISGPGVAGAEHGAGWLATALVFAALAVGGRGIGFAVIRRIQARGRLTSPALIIGASSVGEAIGRRLHEHPEYGLVTVGYVDSPAHSADSLPAPLLGDLPDLPRLILQHRIRHVLVAFARTPDDDIVDLLRACDRLDCEIFVVPRLFELGAGARSAPDHVWGIPLVHLHRAPFRSRAWAVKRILDVELASLALVLLSPVMLATALALRCELGPHVLFRQARVGLDGRTFELLKFRTLRPPEDDEPDEFCVISPDRVGPVGRFLRRSSLDELPQLWNVLRGQMSLVGPRPEQSHIASVFGYRPV
jgi:hypothetical protein